MQALNPLSPQIPPQVPNQHNGLALNDIHVPEQISDFPMAYGWWLLAVIIIVITVIGINKIKNTLERNRIKKQALAQLKRNANASINETISLLKWAAMHYFSRTELAKLFGDSLQTFLTAQLPMKYQNTFAQLSKQAFLHQYQAPLNTDEDKQSDESFYQAATLWLTHALPPQPNKKIKETDGTSIKNDLGANT